MLPVQGSYVNSVLGVRHGSGVSANTKPGRVMMCETEKKSKSALSKSVAMGSIFNYSTICK